MTSEAVVREIDHNSGCHGKFALKILFNLNCNWENLMI